MILTKGGTRIIEIQSGPEDGIDALIWNLSPDIPRPNNKENTAVAWTYSGVLTIARSLLKFDLSMLDSNTNILHADLFMYGIVSTGNGANKSLNGANYTLLCQITSPWEENTVTWNNQPTFNTSDAVVIDSCVKLTDYVLDVTEHVQKMIENPSENYGWMLVMQTEEYYRRMTFSSSDHDIASTRPKLIIQY